MLLGFVLTCHGGTMPLFFAIAHIHHAATRFVAPNVNRLTHPQPGAWLHCPVDPAPVTARHPALAAFSDRLPAIRLVMVVIRPHPHGRSARDRGQWRPLADADSLQTETGVGLLHCAGVCTGGPACQRLGAQEPDQAPDRRAQTLSALAGESGADPGHQELLRQ